MNPKLLFCFLVWGLSCLNAGAQVTPQCPMPPPPGAEACNTTCVYCDFDGYTGINNGSPSGGNTVCGQISIHNDQWFGFVAGTSTISIDILTSNCVNGDGLQAAFFESCAEDAIVCNAGFGGGGGAPLNLTYDDFVPGQTYYLMIDGWTGDVCNYEIDLVGGSITPPPPGQPQQPQGPTQVCPGAVVVYTIPDVPGAGWYRWLAPAGSSINGGTSSVQLPAPEGTTVTITFGNSGGQVCVQAGNACFPALQACLPVVNQPIPPTILPPMVICYEDAPFTWEEAPGTILTFPGTYTLNSTPYDSYLGCDSVIRQVITIKSLIGTNLGTRYICEGECITVNGNPYCNSGGPFTETMTSYQGCDSVLTFNIVKVPAVANILPVPPVDCTNPTQLLNSGGSTSGPNATYSWTNAAWSQIGNMSTQTINSGGMYNLIVTNSLGGKTCRDTTSVNVTSNTVPPGASASGGTLGCLATNLTVTLQGSSPTGGVNYQWTGPGINPGNQNLANPTVNQAGNYIVTVTNPANNCTSTATATVLANNTAPTATAAGSIITCAQPVGTLTSTTDAAQPVYLWSGPGINPGNQNQANPSVSLSGNYLLTVTNQANGCSATATATVGQNNALPTVSAGPNQTITCTQASVTLSGSGSAGGSAVQLNWTGPGINPGNQTVATPSVNQPGTYILTVTNPANSCAASDTVIVDAQINPPTALAGADQTITCVLPSVTLNSTGSSTGANFQALWTGPGMAPPNNSMYSPTVNQGGTFQLTITNTSNGCTATDAVTVNVDIAQPTVDAGQDMVLTCTSTNGVSLNASASPGTVTYFWTGPGIGANNQTQSNPMVSQAGNYNVTVTNPANGCTATDLTVVTQDANVPAASAGADLVLNCAITSVNLDGSGSSSGAGITYAWTGPGISGGNSTAMSPTGILLPGTYNLTVTNTTNNCVNSDVVVVAIDTLHPVASAGQDQVLNCVNGSTATLDASASSTGPNITLSWTGVNPAEANLPNPEVNQPGIYVLTVTNTTNQCTATDQVAAVADLTPPTADAGADRSIDCAVTAVTVGGNSSTGANFVYEWLGPDITPANDDIPQPVVSLAGNYQLTVTDYNNGCSSTDEVTVFLNTTYPTASAGPDRKATCFEPMVSLDGSGSSNGATIGLVWAGPDITPANQNQPSPSVSAPGLYILTLTDNSNSCVSRDTVEVTEDKVAPAASAGPDGLLDCQTVTLTLDGSLSASGAVIGYAWTGNGITPANQSQQSPLVDQPGAYTLVVTNTDNGCTSQDAVTVDQDIAAPTASAGADITLTCVETILPLDGAASSSGSNFEYSWQGPGIDPGNSAQQNPMVADSGTYTLVVTNTQNHCTATDGVLVIQNTAYPTASAGPDQKATCFEPMVSLDGSASSTGATIGLVWAGPDITPANQNQPSPSVSAPGLYILTLTDNSNSCVSRDTVEVTEDKVAPAASAGPDGLLDCQTVTLMLDGSLSASGAIFGYAWTGNGITPANQAQQNPAIDQPGAYTLVVTNTDNGCTSEDVVTVDQDIAAPTASAGADITLTCVETILPLDGAASSSGSSFGYSWQGPGIDPGNIAQQNPMVAESGTYTLVVTNTQNHCTATDAVTVFLNATYPTAIGGPDRKATCFEPMVSLDGSASSNGATIELVWAGPDITPANQNQPTPSVSAPGLYILTLTDNSNSCVSRDTVEVTEDKVAPAASAGPDGLLDCQTVNLTLDGSLSASGAIIEYAWTGNAITPANQSQQSPLIDQPGTYTLLVSNTDNGCTSEDVVTVDQDIAAPTASAGADITLTCMESILPLDGNASSSGANFAYSWQGPGINAGNIAQQNPMVGDSGTYTLLVTNTQNHCTATDFVAVALNGDFPATQAGADQTLTCAVTTVQLDGSQSQSGAGITYTWSGPGINASNQNEVMPTVDEPGSYMLTVNNTNNGCSKTDFVDVGTDYASPVASAGADLELTCTSTGVTLSSAGSSTGTGFSLLWSGPGIDATNEADPNPFVTVAGSYNLVVTNTVNGCTQSDATQVSTNADVPTSNAGNDQLLNCAITQATLDGSGSTSGSTIVFQWQGPGINAGNQNQPMPVVSQAGTYTLTILNTATGCSATDNVLVDLDNAQPQVAVEADTITCTEPGTLSVTSSLPGSTFLWSGPGISGANQTLATLNVGLPGPYQVVVTAPNGCSALGSVTMPADENIPQGSALGAVLNCSNNGQSTITGTVLTGGASGSWTGPNGFTSALASPTVTQPGTYTFAIAADNGCKIEIDVAVETDFAQPAASATVSELLDCNTTSVTIQNAGTASGPGFTYAWTTSGGNIVSGTNSLNPVVDAPGQYSLVVTDQSNGCTALATVSVQQDPSVPTGINLIVRNIRCFGESTGSIAIDGVIGGTAPFEFILTDENDQELDQYVQLTAGDYHLSVEDANGCLIDSTVTIVEPSELLVELGEDTTIQLGESLTLDAQIASFTPLSSIAWDPADQCDSLVDFCTTFTDSPLKSYRQRITVRDTNGCVATDEMLVLVNKDRLVYVANVFSPESDDPENALLKISGGTGVVRIKSWLIFDRWGEAVHEVRDFLPNSVDAGWDGRVRGQVAPSAVYVWYAEIEFVDGLVEMFKGDVTLVRL